MANFRDEALYRQANFLGPVVKVIYAFRYPSDEDLEVTLSSVLGGGRQITDAIAWPGPLRPSYHRPYCDSSTWNTGNFRRQ